MRWGESRDRVLGAEEGKKVMAVWVGGESALARPLGKDEPMYLRGLSLLVGCAVLCDCILGKEILRCRSAEAGYGSKDAKLGARGIHWMVLFR